MSANITDYFNKASNMNGSYPAVATVTAARSTGGSTLSCDDLSSWATDTPVHFSTFKVNTDGSIDTTTQTDWKGIVNGNTITDMTRLAGAADSGNASGDRVELNPTIGWLDDLVTGLLVAHKQNGALKDNAVTESSISTGAVTNTKLGDSSVTTAKLDSGAVTSAKIATGAINSYDKIGDDVIQARNMAPEVGDYSTSEVDTGFIWIDGKHIYKKTINFGQWPNATSKSVAHGISNFSTVIRLDGYMKNTNTGKVIVLPYVPTNSSFLANINFTSTNITIESVGNLSAYNESYIALYYIKTS